MRRKLLAGAAGVAVLVVGLILTFGAIVALEISATIPDGISFIVLPGGGLASLGTAAAVAYGVYRFTGEAESGDATA